MIERRGFRRKAAGGLSGKAYYMTSPADRGLVSLSDNNYLYGWRNYGMAVAMHEELLVESNFFEAERNKDAAITRPGSGIGNARILCLKQK